MRQRTVLCVDPMKNPVSETLCDSSNKPELHQPCISAPCQYVWVTATWTQVRRLIYHIYGMYIFLLSSFVTVSIKKLEFLTEYQYDCCIINTY